MKATVAMGKKKAGGAEPSLPWFLASPPAPPVATTTIASPELALDGAADVVFELPLDLEIQDAMSVTAPLERAQRLINWMIVTEGVNRRWVRDYQFDDECRGSWWGFRISDHPHAKKHSALVAQILCPLSMLVVAGYLTPGVVAMCLAAIVNRISCRDILALIQSTRTCVLILINQLGALEVLPFSVVNALYPVVIKPRLRMGESPVPDDDIVLARALRPAVVELASHRPHEPFALGPLLAKWSTFQKGASHCFTRMIQYTSADHFLNFLLYVLGAEEFSARIGRSGLEGFDLMRSNTPLLSPPFEKKTDIGNLPSLESILNEMQSQSLSSFLQALHLHTSWVDEPFVSSRGWSDHVHAQSGDQINAFKLNFQVFTYDFMMVSPSATAGTTGVDLNFNLFQNFKAQPRALGCPGLTSEESINLIILADAVDRVSKGM